MRTEIKVSIASKMEHASKLAKIRRDGIHICSRWIHMAEKGHADMKPITHWMWENFSDIDNGHFHMYYIEAGDKLKNGLLETGYALKAGKLIWVVGDGNGVEIERDGVALRVPHKDVLPWALYRSQIRLCLSIETAFSEMFALVNRGTIKNVFGVEVAPPTFWDEHIVGII